MDSMRAEIEQLRADISQAYDLRDKAEGRYCTALGAIEQLHAAVKTAQELAARRLMEIEKLRKALKVAQQSLIEFRHAQECGPSWYTRGANGMYQQVSLWLRRGLEAVKDALGPYDDNGQYLKEMPAHEPSEHRCEDRITLNDVVWRCTKPANHRDHERQPVATPGATPTGEDSVRQPAESSRPRELLSQGASRDASSPTRPSPPPSTSRYCVVCDRIKDDSGETLGWALCECGSFRQPATTVKSGEGQ